MGKKAEVSLPAGETLFLIEDDAGELVWLPFEDADELAVVARAFFCMTEDSKPDLESLDESTPLIVENNFRVPNRVKPKLEEKVKGAVIRYQVDEFDFEPFNTYELLGILRRHNPEYHDEPLKLLNTSKWLNTAELLLPDQDLALIDRKRPRTQIYQFSFQKVEGQHSLVKVSREEGTHLRSVRQALFYYDDLVEIERQKLGNFSVRLLQHYEGDGVPAFVVLVNLGKWCVAIEVADKLAFEKLNQDPQLFFRPQRPG